MLALDTSDTGNKVKRMVQDDTTNEWQEDTTTPTQGHVVAILTYWITNNPGVKLPSTGGPGVTVFYVAGVALIALALVMLLRKRETE